MHNNTRNFYYPLSLRILNLQLPYLGTKPTIPSDILQCYAAIDKAGRKALRFRNGLANIFGHHSVHQKDIACAEQHYQKCYKSKIFFHKSHHC